MFPRNMQMALLLANAALLFTGVAAETLACTNVLISMSPCLDYVSRNSSTPSSSCCAQLGSAIQSQPQCLCHVLNGGFSPFGININQTLAFALPRACNVETPPISQCNAASPALSPAESPESSNTIPSGSGTKTVPAMEEDMIYTSEGSFSKLSISLLFVFLFTTSYISLGLGLQTY